VSAVDQAIVRLVDAETQIAQNTTDISLRVTKTEVERSLSGYYTKEDTLALLSVTSDEIVASVGSNFVTKEELSEVDSAITGDINEIHNIVESKMSSTDVEVKIQTALGNGVDKVVTSTGYKLDKDGLSINKTGSEMSTAITDDGMTVYKSGDPVLIANNVGVEATNLHAKTYLIIGNNSRFEDYDSDRTGCFWVGN
jgi:hypothetical protein